MYKFSQFNKLYDYILSFPENTVFVEANPSDNVWGIGLSSKDKQALNPNEWRGENNLGFQITRVRDTFLKSTYNGQIYSYAYHDFIHQVNWGGDQVCQSLDFLSSSLNTFKLTNYSSLTQLRLSKCRYLKFVSISDMPNLRVVDLLDNRQLTDVQFKNCPNFDTLEVGYCQALQNLKGIEKIEYLSAPHCDSLDLPQLPENIVYLDISGIQVDDPTILLQSLPKIECFVYTGQNSFKLSEITKIKTLKVLHLEHGTLICDSRSSKTFLRSVIFDSDRKLSDCIEGNFNLLKGIYVTTKIETNQNIHVDFDDFKPEYQNYQRLFYGPWGIPPIDLTLPVHVNSPIITPPSKIDKQKASFSILGSLFASAIMDMIGVGVEFIPDRIAKILLPGDLNISWSHPRCNNHNKRFVRGTPTDDTSQCILIMRSIVDSNTKFYNSKSIINFNNVKIDPCDFAAKLVDWIYHGHKEHKHPGGLGVGATTLGVVNNELFLTDPIKTSNQAWISGGKKAAPNGSVMRIASSGCFAFWDEKVVVEIASCFAKVTHADPRCVFSSIAAALLIARYIQFNSNFIDSEPDIDKTLNDAKKYVPEIGSYAKDVDFYIHAKTIEELNLSENKKIGYCLKALGSAVWALRYCNSFEEGLIKVLREGGDSDTNGAVVGALLGAKFGVNSIPNEMIYGMFVGQWMINEIKPFMQLMGIEMPESPYFHDD